MIYGDVCSGISAPTVAWHPLGWRAAWYSEIEMFPCRVLQHHYPGVPNLGNMLSLIRNQTFLNDHLDLLVGGTPCQSFSIAGLRKGLADARGNLALEYCRLLWTKRQQGKPIRWFVWENVPGALSSYSDETGEATEESSDFAAILSAFRECGYSCAWRVFDAQYFGVPQRRRRLFVVGYFGNDWRPPAAVLFDGQGVPGNIEPGANKKVQNTGSIENGITAYQSSQSGFKISGTHATLDKSNGSRRYNGDMYPCWWDGGQLSQTLDRVLSKGQTMPEKNRFPAVLAPDPLYFETRLARNGRGKLDNVAAPLKAQSGKSGKGDGSPMILDGLIVRRLTPLECERLQGFPDNYTLIPGASDTVRYQAIGNSMAVPVMRWIGQRIDLLDKYITLIS
jgi:DNA (cytosine-5)-methyltransferase 1